MNLAKARSRSNSSCLGFDFLYPHHDSMNDFLFFRLLLFNLLIKILFISECNDTNPENVAIDKHASGMLGRQVTIHCAVKFRCFSTISQLKGKGPVFVWKRNGTDISNDKRFNLSTHIR